MPLPPAPPDIPNLLTFPAFVCPPPDPPTLTLHSGLSPVLPLHCAVLSHIPHSLFFTADTIYQHIIIMMAIIKEFPTCARKCYKKLACEYIWSLSLTIWEEYYYSCFTDKEIDPDRGSCNSLALGVFYSVNIYETVTVDQVRLCARIRIQKWEGHCPCIQVIRRPVF